MYKKSSKTRSNSETIFSSKKSPKCHSRYNWHLISNYSSRLYQTAEFRRPRGRIKMASIIQQSLPSPYLASLVSPSEDTEAFSDWNYWNLYLYIQWRRCTRTRGVISDCMWHRSGTATSRMRSRSVSRINSPWNRRDRNRWMTVSHPRCSPSPCRNRRFGNVGLCGRDLGAGSTPQHILRYNWNWEKFRVLTAIV